MTKDELKQQINDLIDKYDAGLPSITYGGVPASTVAAPAEEPKKELPDGKRVVRTKTSGDRVYLLDEVKKTRQWVATEEVLAALGYDQSDVVEVSDTDLYKYSMGATLYKVE